MTPRSLPKNPRSKPFIYRGEQLREVAFPLGGIGTGCVSLEGRGALHDWEIFNRPNKGSILPMTFPILWCQPEGGQAQTRVVQGPRDKDFIGTFDDTKAFYGYGHGQIRQQGDGLPHFESVIFRGTFPFARLEFAQTDYPLAVSLTAFNPFIPLDARASGMPLASLTYTLRNTTDKPVQATLVLNLFNAIGFEVPEDKDHPDQAANIFRQGTHCRGLEFTNPRFADPRMESKDTRYGTMALTTDWPDTTHLAYWIRSGWYDSMHHFWDLLTTRGELDPAATDVPGKPSSGALGLKVTLQPGQSADLPFLISWCFPNVSKYWVGHASNPDPHPPQWINAYATQENRGWPTAWHAAEDFFAHRKELTSRTEAFEQSMMQSTLPPEVIESVTATASILHSPTCIRYEDGTFWGWEGCSHWIGCCEGSCSHVWNYSLTHAFLFPDLQRSMRRSEYQYSFESGEEGKKGALVFRVALPLGTPAKVFEGIWGHAAADGQLGVIVQLYRDWRYCGDDEYLRFMWPHAKLALEYAWHHWDRDRDGLIDGDQHNTYDINFQGPNPLMQFFYLAALRAGAEMAGYLGDAASAAEYRRMVEIGQKKAMELFNGEYFEQALDCMAAEAPKYQHGKGCLSDQVFGQLAAHVAGLGYVGDPAQVKSALAAVFKHNFRAPLGDHANMQRIFAFGDQSGLLLCSWPRGARPHYPFPYSDEVWTGIEYQVASHLIYEGLVEEGVKIVAAIRGRHDGRRRNPYNEFECGSHYARALASWGVLLALSGFRYDAVDKTLHLEPRGPKADNMRCFFSTGSAWGTFRWRDGQLTVEVKEGQLVIDKVVTPNGTTVSAKPGKVIKAGKRGKWTVVGK